MRVLVISDSRGWPIYNQIMGINWLLLGMTLDILIYPGATISQGIRYAINDIQYNAYDIIYVYLGVCNLSKKLSQHNIIPIYSNRYLMCRNLLIDYHTARRRLRPYCNKVIIFCTRKKSKTCYNHINYSGRSYRQYNKEVFQNLLMNENWEEYWQYDNPEVC